MSSIILPRRYRTKPPLGTQVDWSNPLTRGLHDFLLFNEAGGQQVTNLAAPVFPAAGENSPTWSATAAGPGGRTTNPNGTVGNNCQGWKIANHGQEYGPGNNATWRIVHQPNSYPNASYNTLIDDTNQTAGTGSSGTRNLNICVNSSGNVSYTEAATSFGSTGVFATGMTPGKVWDFVVVVAGGSVTFYVNGVPITGPSFTVSPISGCNVTLGASPSNTSGAGYDGTYILYQSWSRALSASEVQTLYLNPSAVFKTAPRIYIPDTVATSGGSVPAGTFTIAGIDTLSGSGVVLVPALPSTVSDISTLAGNATVLVPAPHSTGAASNSLAGSGAVLVPAGPTTLAGIGTLSGTAGVLVPAGPATIRGIGSLTASGAGMVPSGAATFTNINTLAGGGAVLVPAPPSTIVSIDALSGAGDAFTPTDGGSGIVATVGALSGSGVVIAPAGAGIVSNISGFIGNTGPVIVATYALYRAASRINLFRALARRNIYRARGAVGMSALQDNGQSNSLLRYGETNQPFYMDYKTVPLGTDEHVTGCSVVVKQVTSYSSVDVTAQLCPVQPTSNDIANDVVTAYLDGSAATVGAKYKVIFYATTSATKPTVRVEDISYVYCDE